MPRYSRKIVIGVVSAIILGSALILGLSYMPQGTRFQSNNSYNNPSFAGGNNCISNYNGFQSTDPNQTYPEYPVLSMPINSDAIVCVTYSNPTNSNQTFDLSGILGIEIGTFKSNTSSSGTTLTWFSPSSNFTVMPNVTSLLLTPKDTQTVSFVIHSDSDSNGFYFLYLYHLGPKYCNIGLPLAVGYTFSTQNKSGAYFNPESQQPLCYQKTMQFAHANILGFVGMQQVYVDCGGWICDT